MPAKRKIYKIKKILKSIMGAGPVLEGDAVYEGLLDGEFEGGGELGPMAGDLLAKEDGGELADVGGLCGAEVVDEGGHNSRVLGQALDLLLRLPPGVVVRHQELYEQKLQRLRHRTPRCLLLPLASLKLSADEAERKILENQG